MSSIRHLSDTTGMRPNSGDIITTLTNQGQLFIFSYSPALKTLVAWSNNAELLLGAKDVALARDANLFMRYVHADDKFALLTQFEKALQEKSQLSVSYRWLRPDNQELRWLHCRGQVIRKDDEELFEGLIIDLTDEFDLTTQRVLGLSAPDAILRSLPVSLFVLDRDLRITYLNFDDKSGFNFGDPRFDYTNFRTGRLLLACFNDDLQKKQFALWLNEILEGALQCREARIGKELAVHKLTLLPVVDYQGIAGVLGVIADVRETLQLEREVTALQKASGLKTLSGATSHYLNNCLQSVIGQADLITVEPENKARVSSAAQTIIDLVSRAAALSRELFNLEEGLKPEPRLIDLNLQLLAAAGAEKDFSSGVKSGVVFGNISKVQAHEADAQKVLSALLRSALNALLMEPNEGYLSLKTADAELEQDNNFGLSAGSYVKVSMTTNYRTKARLETKTKTGDFSPQGADLGEALKIVKRCGGTITISRNASAFNADEKLTFTLLWPAAQSGETPDQNEVQVLNPVILVVDDDQLVSASTKSLLQGLGYQAVSAANYTQALSYAKRYHNSLKAVLLDLLMPGMNGLGILKRLRKIKPALKIIGFTGASVNEVSAFEKAGLARILVKPVSAQALKEALAGLGLQDQA